MEELIKGIAQAIVDNPDQVHVKKIEGDRNIIFELRVAKEDIGKIIGKGGKNIDAIRSILTGASGKHKKRCRLELIEEARSEVSPRLTDKRPKDLQQESFEKRTGIVTMFDASKGYGFITMDDGGEIFVHHSSVIEPGLLPLTEGDRVTFEVIQGDKGLKAINVTKTVS